MKVVNIESTKDNLFLLKMQSKGYKIESIDFNSLNRKKSILESLLQKEN